MCFVWEGKIERCQNCSETEFQTVLRVVWNVEPARPIHQKIARPAQQSLDQGDPNSSRHDVDIDFHRKSTVENLLDREQHLAHQARPSSSRNDTPINGTMQHKLKKTDADQPYASAHHALINGTAQHKRQKLDPVQKSTLKHDGRIEEQRQHGRQGPTPEQVSSLRQDTRIHGAAQFGRPMQSRNQTASSMSDTRGDQADGYGQKETRQAAQYPSRHHNNSDLIDEEGHQLTRSDTSPNSPRVEDVEVLTAGMNQLPPPSWEDQRVILPLIQQQLIIDRYYQRQRQRLVGIWALYKKEREALAAIHTPEPEEIWEPDFEEVEILKHKIPLMEEIWVRSVLAGDTWMREILDKDVTWLQERPEEPNIWTREEGGMLSAIVLKKLLGLLNLQAALREE